MNTWDFGGTLDYKEFLKAVSGPKDPKYTTLREGDDPDGRKNWDFPVFNKMLIQSLVEMDWTVTPVYGVNGCPF